MYKSQYGYTNKKTDGKPKTDLPHFPIYVRRHNKKGGTAEQMNQSYNKPGFILNVDNRRLRGNNLLPEFSSENKNKHSVSCQPRKQSRKSHNRGISGEIDSRARSEKNIRGIADNKRHTPRICRNKFPDKIRQRINSGVFCKVTDKRRKSKHDNIVGSNNRQHRNGKIKNGKQSYAVMSRVFKRRRGKITEKNLLRQDK